MIEVSRLNRVVSWAQQLAGEVLAPGDLAVDLTAGGGRDTLELFRRVGSGGRVLAFDVQRQALEQTAARLTLAGARVLFPWSGTLGTESPPGVYLVHACHTALGRHLAAAPKAVLGNFGYLPGGDPSLTTRAATTRVAIAQSLDCLTPAGRLAVVLYRGHPGAPEEAAAVEEVVQSLPPSGWQTLRLEVANRPLAPYLLLVERRA